MRKGHIPVGDITDAIAGLLSRFSAPGKLDKTHLNTNVDVLFSKKTEGLVRFNGVTPDNISWTTDFFYNEFGKDPRGYIDRMIVKLMRSLQEHRRNKSPLILMS